MKRLALASLGILAGCCNPPDVASVNVPPQPQMASNWCWNASQKMILDYLGTSVPHEECVAANNEFNRTDCCNADSNGNTPSACNHGGWPQIPKSGKGIYGYTDTQTWNAALPYSTIQSQVYCSKQPVGFSWHWAGGGGHYMVITGYQVVNGVQYLNVNNPEPHTNLKRPAGGTQEVMTYDEYVAVPDDHTHWRDDYLFIKNAGG
jgi:Papain-like cysteine protease AvrRpt2